MLFEGALRGAFREMLQGDSPGYSSGSKDIFTSGIL